MPFSPLATATIRLTASLGPFGLAFPGEPDANTTMSCDPLKGRPFVTGLAVMRLSAPLGGRDAYEFRLQCGASTSAWSQLGPSPLMWASAEQAETACIRPNSATGMVVTRGRAETGRQDHFFFTLLCGADLALAEVDMESSRHVGQVERGGQKCPSGSFVSGVEVQRGFVPQGAYDLYEFKLHCSEIVDLEEENARENGAAAAAAATSSAAGGGQDPRERLMKSREARLGRSRTSGVVNKGKEEAPEETGEGEGAAPAAKMTSMRSTSAGRRQGAFGAPEAAAEPSAEPAAAGGGGGGVDLDMLKKLLDAQREKDGEEQQRKARAKQQQTDLAGADAVFGRLRSGAAADDEDEDEDEDEKADRDAKQAVEEEAAAQRAAAASAAPAAPEASAQPPADAAARHDVDERLDAVLAKIQTLRAGGKGESEAAEATRPAEAPTVGSPAASSTPEAAVEPADAPEEEAEPVEASAPSAAATAASEPAAAEPAAMAAEPAVETEPATLEAEPAAAEEKEEAAPAASEPAAAAAEAASEAAEPALEGAEPAEPAPAAEAAATTEAAKAAEAAEAAIGAAPTDAAAAADRTAEAAAVPEREACTPDPSAVCTMDFRPVCGKDGRTYSNRCRARASCQLDATEGECPSAPAAAEGEPEAAVVVDDANASEAVENVETPEPAGQAGADGGVDAGTDADGAEAEVEAEHSAAEVEVPAEETASETEEDEEDEEMEVHDAD